MYHIFHQVQILPFSRVNVNCIPSYTCWLFQGQVFSILCHHHNSWLQLSIVTVDRVWRRAGPHHVLIYAGSSNIVVGLTVLKEVLARNFPLTYVALHCISDFGDELWSLLTEEH